MATTENKKLFSGPLERLLKEAAEALVDAGYPLLAATWVLECPVEKPARERLRALSRFSGSIQAQDDTAAMLRQFMQTCDTLAKEQATVRDLENAEAELEGVINLSKMSKEAEERRDRAGKYLLDVTKR